MRPRERRAAKRAPGRVTVRAADPLQLSRPGVDGAGKPPLRDMGTAPSQLRELAWTRRSAGGFPAADVRRARSHGVAALHAGPGRSGLTRWRGRRDPRGRGLRPRRFEPRVTRVSEVKRRCRPPPASIRIDGQDVRESARAVVVHITGPSPTPIDAVVPIIDAEGGVFPRAIARGGLSARPCRDSHARPLADGGSAAGRGLEEPFEQRAELAGAPEVLRMPLDAEAEARGRIFDRFDDAVGRGGRHDEARRDVPSPPDDGGC